MALTRAKKKLVVLLTNPSIQRNFTLLDLLFQDALTREIVTRVTMDQVTELKEIHQITRNQQRLQRFTAGGTLGIANNFEDRLDSSLGNPINIFFKSIQLMLRVPSAEEICLLCLESIQRGVQCIGCNSWFHEKEFRKWLSENQHCPVCKNTVLLVEEVKE